VDSTAPRNPAFGLTVVCFALTLVMGSMTSVAVGLPDIARSTGASQRELTWIVDSYTLAFAGLLLPCGALGDRFGRRRMLIVGLLIFAVASAVAPIGDDPGMVIAARAISGVGAALVMPATLSLITTTMPGAIQERAVSIWIATCTFGGALGLAFSGLILEFSDWRAILYSTAVAAVLVALAADLAEESSDPERHRFDVAGAVTSAAAIGLVVFGITEGPVHGWASVEVWMLLAAGLLFFLAFIALELTREHPLLDIRIFRSRWVLTGSLTLLAIFGVLFAFFFLSMQFQQLVEGRSALVSGLLVLPAACTLVPLSLVAPAMAVRLGLRAVTLLGLLPLMGGLGLMATMEAGDWVVFEIALLLMGAGFGLCITPATVAILRSVPAAKQGVASAVNDAVREVGAALGIAVAGSLLATGYTRNLGHAVDALPESARHTVEASLAGALEVQARLGPAAGPAVTEARAAFVSGIHTSFFACTVFTVVCAVAVAVAAPGRVRPTAEPVPRSD
jgi:EmrB/QacA subfamily drug resistance transporter